MANAKKCDRCGKYYDKNESHSTDTNYGRSRIDGVAFTTKNGSYCNDYDLCDECIGLLKEWLKGEKVMNDGVYIELFAVKDGVRYNAKILDMKEVTLILTNGLLNGIENLWEENNNA